MNLSGGSTSAAVSFMGTNRMRLPMFCSARSLVLMVVIVGGPLLLIRHRGDDEVHGDQSYELRWKLSRSEEVVLATADDHGVYAPTTFRIKKRLMGFRFDEGDELNIDTCDLRFNRKSVGSTEWLLFLYRGDGANWKLVDVTCRGKRDSTMFAW